MDTEIQVQMQPVYPVELASRLFWFVHSSGYWAIGLPIHIDAESFTPPCYVMFQPNASALFAGGLVHQVSAPPLPIRVAIKVLDSMDVSSVANNSGVSEGRVILVLEKAIEFLCNISGLSIPAHDWSKPQSIGRPIVGVYPIKMDKEGA